MSLDDIKRITEAEHTAGNIVTEAQNEARLLISQAEQSGKAFSERVRAEAENKVKQLLLDAEDIAAQRNKSKTAELDKYCAALNAGANAKLDESAGIIVERIVNF